MNISTSLCAAAQSLQHVYTDFSFAAFSKFIQYLNCTANSLASARSGGVPENACSRDPIIPFTCSIYITKTQLVLVLHLAIAMNYEETGGSVPLLACRIRSISSGVWASSSSSLASRISARSIGSSILSVSSVPCAFTDNYVPVVKFLLCLEEKKRVGRTIYSALLKSSPKTAYASFTLPLNSLARSTTPSPLVLYLSGCNSRWRRTQFERRSALSTVYPLQGKWASSCGISNGPAGDPELEMGAER